MPPVREAPHREKSKMRWRGEEECVVQRMGGWTTNVGEGWALRRRSRTREFGGRLALPFASPRVSMDVGAATDRHWVAPVATRLMELATLPRVAPGARRPMSFEDMVEALTFLSRVMREDTVVPWIGRLSSGGLQLTWQRGDVEVEAVFDGVRGERNVIVVVGDHEWEAPVDQADSLFATVVDRLHV